MTRAILKIVIFTLLSLGFFSCLKEKPVSVDFEVIQLPINLAVTKIVSENDSVLWATLGDKFGRGAVLNSINNGLSWNVILDYDYEIRDIRFKNGRIYIFPIGNKILWSDDRGISWQDFTMPGWEFFSAGIVLDNNNIIVAGGENFGKGVLHFVSSTNFNADTIQHELSDMVSLNDSTLITVGYGVILKSTDRGQNWLPDEARGDFYRAVSFADENNGFVVGDYGSIHKTSDAGRNWKKIKSGSTFFNSTNRFKDVHFNTSEEGSIAGSNGLLWYSKNSGKTWIPISNLPDLDFESVLTRNNKILAGARGGKIVLMDKP